MKEGWTTRKFSDIFDLQMGKTPSRDNSSYWGGTNTWVSIADMNCGKYIYDTKEHITNSAVSESGIYRVSKDTVIMSFKLSIGKTAIATKDLYTNEAIMSFNTKEGFEILPDYIYYYLKGYKWQGMNKAVMGMTLNKKAISNNIFSYPNTLQQQHIVEELDLLSSIIEKKKAQLNELDNLAQSLFYEMFGDPISNEKGWEVKKLGKLCITSSGGTPSKTHKEYYEGGNIPWLRSGEVAQGYIYNTEMYITEEGLNNSSAKYFPINTVVVAMYGATVGQVGILKSRMTTNQAICGIFPSESFVPTFLMFFLKGMKPVYLKDAAGGAQPNISQGVIKNTLVPIVSIALQQQFVERIEAIEHQKELIKQSIKEVETLFNSRMDYYFN